MRKLAATALLTAASAATALGLSASPALAASTWTITGGPGFTGSATNTKLTSGSATLSCTSSSASGATTFTGTQPANLFTDPDGDNDTVDGYYDIAELNSVSFTGCTGPLGITFSVASGGLPWIFTAEWYDATNGVTHGILQGIHAHLSGSLCSADVDGSSANAFDGFVEGSYNNNTGQLTIDSGVGPHDPDDTNLHVYNVNGCFGLISNGGSAQFSGTYNISPALTITSP